MNHQPFETEIDQFLKDVRIEAVSLCMDDVPTHRCLGLAIQIAYAKSEQRAVKQGTLPVHAAPSINEP